MQSDPSLAQTSARSSLTTKRGKPRQRSAIACGQCHLKRVRCSAHQSGIPCINCRKTHQECRLIESKRGSRKTKNRDPPSDSLDSPQDDERSRGGHVGSFDVPLPTLEQNESVSDPSMVLPPDVIIDRTIYHDDTDEPDALYARVVFDESAATCHPPKPNAQVVYLGETFNLTHLLRTTNPEARRSDHQLHRTLLLDSRPPPRPLHSDAEYTHDLLERQGAFTLPSETIIHELFRAYFTSFHPHYPVLERGDFAARYRRPLENPSYFLFQTVLFSAAGHCEMSVLRRAGFSSRHEARSILFRRAKALYDADHESDKVIVVQAIFLMSFWWSSPTDQKDTWHWLGNAISLAVSMGMHRSTRNSLLNVRQQRLWKRIWWSLFTEDKHAAAALGRPVHIHFNDCDVEPLAEIDCREDAPPREDWDVFGVQEEVHIQYVIYLSELSKIVERIIEGSFNAFEQFAADRMSTLESSETLLDQWESRLPPELQARKSSDGLWAGMLHIASWQVIVRGNAHR
jgi:hypothetical protein